MKIIPWNFIKATLMRNSNGRFDFIKFTGKAFVLINFLAFSWLDLDNQSDPLSLYLNKQSKQQFNKILIMYVSTSSNLK